MATYNGEKFIMDQIISILNQLEEHDELIISDDSSTDSTVRLIREIDDNRIRIYENNLFRNHTKNFENALRYAQGDYIFLSDQDDIWLNHKYIKTIELLKEYDLVISDSIVTDEKLVTVNPSFFNFLGSGRGIIKNIIKNSYYGSCMAFRRSILLEALPFPKSTEVGHDIWLGLVAEVIGKVHFYQEPLILYRRHDFALTLAGTGTSSRSLSIKLYGRLLILKSVILLYCKIYLLGKRTSIHNNSGI